MKRPVWEAIEGTRLTLVQMFCTIGITALPFKMPAREEKMTMDYDHFRAAWREALDAARLLPFITWPTETIDLGWMSRTYSVVVHFPSEQRTSPFHVTACLNWQWDALLSARGIWREEDVLMELLGRDRNHYDTEQPWLRIDVTLRAGLPMDSPMPRPRTRAWQRWVTDVMDRLAPLLPKEVEEENGALIPLAWCGDPTAQFHCAPDGRLYLSSVELSAWQCIDLPREWDDSTREQDPEPDAQLVDFAGRVREALHVWEDCLQHLQPSTTSRPRNTSQP